MTGVDGSPGPAELDALLRRLAAREATREGFWIELLGAVDARRVAEIGVFRGAFAEALLAGLPAIERYWMIDPWRHLDDWAKPSNVGDAEFERHRLEALARTAFAAEKRVELRGRTVDVIDRIGEGALDFAYVDGDHTLRGITIDLVRAWPKVRVGGLLGGDDFKHSIWQHPPPHEPTLVFPFAVHFAEAVGAPIWALPRAQFLILKTAQPAFAFTDLVGKHGDRGLRRQLEAGGRGGAERR